VELTAQAYDGNAVGRLALAPGSRPHAQRIIARGRAAEVAEVAEKAGSVVNHASDSRRK
jgi:hypothetical protein